MTRTNMRRCTSVLLLALGALTTNAFAQAYPVKPVRLIVPFPPGGGFDAIGRPYAERLGVALGQTIIIDNRPGASGNIGASAAAKSSSKDSSKRSFCSWLKASVLAPYLILRRYDSS